MRARRTFCGEWERSNAEGANMNVFNHFESFKLAQTPGHRTRRNNLLSKKSHTELNRGWRRLLSPTWFICIHWVDSRPHQELSNFAPHLRLPFQAKWRQAVRAPLLRPSVKRPSVDLTGPENHT